MNALVFLAEAEGGGQVQEIARSFGVDWIHLIAQIISFCIVCFVLQRYAYKPVLTMLQVRRQRIAEGLADAEKIKRQLAEVETQRQEIVRQANARATQLIEEARLAAARVQAEETRKAVAAAEQVLAKTREAAAREHDQMLLDLRREVGRLVVQTTAALIGRMLTPEDQQRLLLQTVEAVGGNGAPAGKPLASATAAADTLLGDSNLGVTGDESHKTSAARS